nr:MAG TPA: hypothetical protein [Caudoviricetes sp.]
MLNIPKPSEYEVLFIFIIYPPLHYMKLSFRLSVKYFYLCLFL